MGRNKVGDAMNPLFRGHEQLMMFYLLPENIVADRAKMPDFPRDPYEVLNNPKWQEVYKSDYFQLALTDAWAWLIWEHLGVRGKMEQYSGYDPFWRLAHAYTMWMLVFKMMGLTAERYFDFEPGYGLRYLSQEETVEQFVIPMIDYYRKRSNFSEWHEVVRTHRCHEDYDNRQSSVKTEFHRSWYHSRAKIKVLDFVDVEEPGYYPYEKIDSRLDLERFTKRLDEKNRQLVKLLLAGYTQAEIAQRLGFANHSGVCKRIKKIGEQFIEYMKP
jgi:hypothetical protein